MWLVHQRNLRHGEFLLAKVAVARHRAATWSTVEQLEFLRAHESWSTVEQLEFLRAHESFGPCGTLAKLSGVPDDVATVIERAIVSKSPREPHRVGVGDAAAHPRKMMSDRTWDWFLKSSFPGPGVAPKA